MLFGILLAILLTTDVAYGGLMFRYGPNSGDTEFSYNCDDCYQQVYLSNNYRYFYGYNYNLYISSNGYITFGSGYSWFNPWPNYAFYGPKMIAPYWSDIYLPSDPENSHIWYRESSTSKDLKKAKKIIREHFDGCGSYFTPTAVFVVTWADVISYCERWCPWYSWNYYYCYNYYKDFSDKAFANVTSKALNNDTSLPTVDQSEKPEPTLQKAAVSMEEEEKLYGYPYWYWPGRNTFQLVLATDGYNTFAIMNYKQLQWSYCFNYNKMLFNGGYGYHFYKNPVNPTTDLATSSNVHKAGRWAYRISEYKIQTSHCINVGQ